MTRRIPVFAVICIMLLSVLPITPAANSAEPPSVIVLVNDPPGDLSIELLSGESRTAAAVRRVAWEGYYIFYSHSIQTGAEYVLRVTANGETYERRLGTPLRSYNNVFTLNVESGELKPGEYPFRSTLLISMRILLTLLIEGIIFRLFGFRQKRSWIVFTAVNLVTQGALNIWLSGGGFQIRSYLILGLIFMEVFVLAAEMTAMPILIKEHKSGRVLIYTAAANIASLIAGGYIITYLPV
jgi:hypothetical protein